ncbi:YfiR family protein [Roseateles oligotrophus]|uniref:YfiR family protein n=1 Tax=Roseateles oligotrophus TaxID=1769250 RepID=A0ABT2Y8X8_9BURK|nr:YfiR family protein [Roseateles oligotrophus]MCV2366747.1 YfiR family protein [Roseateles oligotrophus]
MRCAVKTWLLLLGFLSAFGTRAAPALDDAQLKAAFIYRFAQFTQWPPPPAREFIYCVAGNVGMQTALQALTLKSHGEVNSRLQVLTDPQQAAQCHLLLLGFDDRAQLQRWQAALTNEPVLVVGDSAEAFRNGAVIALVAEPNGLAFRINHTEAKRRGLILSSHMLKLAREVK